MTPTLYIGIDPGTKTGFAIWNAQKQQFQQVSTMPIHKAMEDVKKYHALGHLIEVVIEKPPKGWSGNNAARAQGAGSIRRDFTVWRDMMEDLKIPFRTVVPSRKGLTKMQPEQFRKMTGWQGRTSNHARDAALMVYGSTMYKKMIA